MAFLETFLLLYIAVVVTLILVLIWVYIGASRNPAWRR